MDKKLASMQHNSFLTKSTGHTYLCNNEFSSWISGFVDGEGCFCISFNLREKNNMGIEVRPSFNIAQNKASLASLELIKNHFLCGTIRFHKKDQTFRYDVRSLSDLHHIILPHFKKYPLLTQKSLDYEKFKQICYLMMQKKHLSYHGLQEILMLAYSMNPAGKRKYPLQKLLSLLDVSA